MPGDLNMDRILFIDYIVSKVFILLDASTSTAKAKKTKFTKTHVKALKKEIADGK